MITATKELPREGALVTWTDPTDPPLRIRAGVVARVEGAETLVDYHRRIVAIPTDVLRVYASSYDAWVERQERAA